VREILFVIELQSPAVQMAGALSDALLPVQVSTATSSPMDEQFCKRICATDTGLPGWAYRTRTGESARELSDWIYVTISFEVERNAGGGDASRASCMMPICSSGQDLANDL
jgi:hypothetical protein